MTLADVLVRARERAPQIASARLALEETRAGLIGASLRPQTNPELDGWVGKPHALRYRLFTDLEFGLVQQFEPGARRNQPVSPE